MNEQAPAHQHYPRDFLFETISFTPAETGIYVILRGECWMHGSIPPDVPKLARMCRCSPAEFDQAWPAMRHLFTAMIGGGWIHPGMNALRKEQEDFRESKSRAGKAGNAVRWGNHPRSHSDTFATRKTIANDRSAYCSLHSAKLASLLAVEIANMQGAYSGTPFAAAAVTPSLIDRILEAGEITTEDELRHFAQFVGAAFRGGRAPGTSSGPKAPALLVRWASDAATARKTATKPQIA